jgi:hypothetical protein
MQEGELFVVVEPRVEGDGDVRCDLGESGALFAVGQDTLQGIQHCDRLVCEIEVLARDAAMLVELGRQLAVLVQVAVAMRAVVLSDAFAAMVVGVADSGLALQPHFHEFAERIPSVVAGTDLFGLTACVPIGMHGAFCQPLIASGALGRANGARSEIVLVLDALLAEQAIWDHGLPKA